MPKYLFLSDEWLAEVRAIRQELQTGEPAPVEPIRMNQIVSDVPFGDGTIFAHFDTTGGTMDVELGHLERPDVTVTLDYDTAKAILVEFNSQVAMQAFMSGKITATGDLGKLMSLANFASTLDPRSAEVAKRVRAMTE